MIESIKAMVVKIRSKGETYYLANRAGVTLDSESYTPLVLAIGDAQKIGNWGEGNQVGSCKVELLLGETHTQGPVTFDVTKTWNNRPCEIRLWESALTTWNACTKYYKGIIKNFSIDNGKISFEVDDADYRDKLIVPSTTVDEYAKDEGIADAYVPEQSKGKRIPIQFGALNDPENGVFAKGILAANQAANQQIIFHNKNSGPDINTSTSVGVWETGTRRYFTGLSESQGVVDPGGDYWDSATNIRNGAPNIKEFTFSNGIVSFNAGSLVTQLAEQITTELPGLELITVVDYKRILFVDGDNYTVEDRPDFLLSILLIGSELLLIQTVPTSNVIAVERGYANTTIATHPSGSPVYQISSFAGRNKMVFSEKFLVDSVSNLAWKKDSHTAQIAYYPNPGPPLPTETASIVDIVQDGSPGYLAYGESPNDYFKIEQHIEVGEITLSPNDGLVRVAFDAGFKKIEKSFQTLNWFLAYKVGLPTPGDTFDGIKTSFTQDPKFTTYPNSSFALLSFGVVDPTSIKDIYSNGDGRSGVTIGSHVKVAKVFSMWSNGLSYPSAGELALLDSGQDASIEPLRDFWWVKNNDWMTKWETTTGPVGFWASNCITSRVQSYNSARYRSTGYFAFSDDVYIENSGDTPMLGGELNLKNLTDLNNRWKFVIEMQLVAYGDDDNATFKFSLRKPLGVFVDFYTNFDDEELFVSSIVGSNLVDFGMMNTYAVTYIQEAYAKTPLNVISQILMQESKYGYEDFDALSIRPVATYQTTAAAYGSESLPAVAMSYGIDESEESFKLCQEIASHYLLMLTRTDYNDGSQGVVSGSLGVVNLHRLQSKDATYGYPSMTAYGISIDDVLMGGTEKQIRLMQTGTDRLRNNVEIHYKRNNATDEYQAVYPSADDSPDSYVLPESGITLAQARLDYFDGNKTELLKIECFDMYAKDDAMRLWKWHINDKAEVFFYTEFTIDYNHCVRGNSPKVQYEIGDVIYLDGVISGVTLSSSHKWVVRDVIKKDSGREIEIHAKSIQPISEFTSSAVGQNPTCQNTFDSTTIRQNTFDSDDIWQNKT